MFQAIAILISTGLNAILDPIFIDYMVFQNSNGNGSCSKFMFKAFMAMYICKRNYLKFI